MRVDRLLKLAVHLESGTLGHKHFNFSNWNEGGTERNMCGTNGCAIGECPILFRKHWRFVINGTGSFIPVLKDGRVAVADEIKSVLHAACYFDVEYAFAQQLFMPNQLRPWNKTAVLGSRATRRNVARSIRQFINWSLKTDGYIGIKV